MQGAILQLNVTDDPAANLPVTRAMLREAVAGGAQFVLTPEVTNCISTSRSHQREVLQSEADDITLAG
jgi:predicted amidohydrolase